MVLDFDAGPGGNNVVTQPVAPQAPNGIETRWNPDLGVFEVYERDFNGDFVFHGFRSPPTGGGGGSADHFFDISPVDQWRIDTDRRDFDYGVGRDAVDDQRWQTEFDYGVQRDQIADQYRNRSLDLENQWRTEGFAVDREGIAQRAAAAQMDYAASMARIQVEAQQAHNQYQIGMANAANDAERNAIQAWWNGKQVEIARMEDQTRRELGFQQNQISQFGAETDRAVGMGNLALENNKFIAEMARSPRDLFGLFMMQRGYTPDWDTMAAGGTPAQGQAIAPVNPMSAYAPTTSPVNFGAAAPANPMAATTGSYTPQPNQWLSGGGGGGVTMPQMPPVSAFNYTPTPATPAASPATTPVTDNRWGSGTYQDPHGSTPTNVEGADDWQSYSGIRNETVAGLGSGQMGLFTTGGAGTSKVGDYKDFRVGIGEGQWLDDPNYIIQPGQSVWLQRKAGGGPTRAPMLMTGDSPLPNPEAGGARPELIFNPTQAPLFIQPNPRSLQDVQRTGQYKQMYDYMGPAHARQSAVPQAGRTPPVDPRKRPVSQVYDYMRAADQRANRHYAMGPAAYKQQLAADFGAVTRQGAFVPQPRPRPLQTVGAFAPQMGRALGGAPALAPEPMLQPLNRASLLASRWRSAPARRFGSFVPRFALGTQGQYEATGMGSLYLPSSTNQHAQGAALPTRMQMLADYGMPLSPALVAAATGGTAPTLNMGAAVTQGRQAGALPSLQTLGRQTKGETEHTRGYYEGVAGVPWADLVDWLGKPTEFLRQAQRARAA